MKITKNGLYSWQIVIIFILLLCCTSGECQLAKPKKPLENNTPPLNSSAQAGTNIEAEKSLSRYHKYIYRIIARDSFDISARYIEMRQQLIAQQKHIAQEEKAIIDQLRLKANKSKSGRLLIDEDVPQEEMQYVMSSINVTSDASSRIWLTLLREKKVDPPSLVNLILGKEHLFSREWIDLAQFIADNSTGQQGKNTAIIVLYRANRQRITYRPVLMDMIEKNNDLTALSSILFEIDPDTGVTLPIHTTENIQYSSRLINDTLKPLLLRLACAKYLFALGARSECEKLINQIVSTKYAGLKNPDAPVTESDRSLFVARKMALTMMFFEFRRDEDFFKVYNISRLPITEVPNTLEDMENPTHNAYHMFVIGEMEIDFAKSLLNRIADPKEN